MPNDKCVKFECPECGFVIWRCQSCRESAKGYECKCGRFRGP